MAAKHRFVVDVNVGRLAKWRRVMGYDAGFPRGCDDNRLVLIALRENKVLVTRGRGFTLRRAAKQGQLRVAYIGDDDLRRQLCQLVREFNLDRESECSRCVRCNVVLRAVAKRELANRAPPYVYQYVYLNHRDFRERLHCRRVYWRGSYWTAMTSDPNQVYLEAG